MLDEARFALETISFDLRHAGIYGRVNETDNVNTDDASLVMATDCSTGWALNVTKPVYAFDDKVSDGDFDLSTCAASWHHGDVLEMRYALGTEVANLVEGVIYTKSNTRESVFFAYNGSNEPVVENGRVFKYVAYAYYISDFTDTAGDGVPSLHRISVEPGLTWVDEVLLSGVEDLQIMLGLDVDDDGTVNTYVKPGPEGVVTWAQVRSAQIWIVVKSKDLQPDLNTEKTFIIGGDPVKYGPDGYRREMVQTVVALRNTKDLDQ